MPKSDELGAVAMVLESLQGGTRYTVVDTTVFYLLGLWDEVGTSLSRNYGIIDLYNL